MGQVTIGAEIDESITYYICFNNCSGHGKCIDYTCYCSVGYHGDDCSTAFVANGDIVPILSVGDFNLTRKNYSSVLGKHNLLLLGLSSYSCLKVESEYVKMHDELRKLQIPFARADVDAVKELAAQHSSDLPALIFYRKKKAILYNGVHAAAPVLAYTSKLLSSPLQVLSSVEQAVDFMYSGRNNSNNKYSISTVFVVAFFRDHEGIEEDDYEDYLETAQQLQERSDIYFGIVTKASVSKWFINNKTIDRTPALLMVDASGSQRNINMNELYEESGAGAGSVSSWVTRNAVPLVGKLVPQNFGLYEKLGLPMLLLFLDLTHEMASSAPGRVVGGRSGGILNEVILDEFRSAAAEHVNRIVFVYLDGNQHVDQMRSLGLYGGKERLPSLAFNTRDGSQIPFPEELPINRDTILQFAADYLSGKLKSSSDAAEMAKRALQATRLNTKNIAKRKPKKEPPPKVTGVSEQFGDQAAGDDAVLAVTSKNFDDIVMNDEKDVLLLLHAQACEPCSHFAVYFKRMAQRFHELNISSLVITRMDVTDEAPPAHLNLLNYQLPILVLLPAEDKNPPFRFYSGVGKMQPMMKWVEEHVSIPFDLPNLPHLKESDRVLYKEQVRERELYLEEKRRKEQEAMDEEDRARAAMEERRKKREEVEAKFDINGEL